MMNMDRMQMMLDMLHSIKQGPLIDEYGHPIEFNMQHVVKRLDPRHNAGGCGTAACILGSLPFYPPFASMGIVLHDGYLVASTNDKALPGWDSDASIASFFGMSMEQLEWLFYNGYVSLYHATIDEAIMHVQYLMRHPEAKQFVYIPGDDEPQHDRGAKMLNKRGVWVRYKHPEDEDEVGIYLPTTAPHLS